MFMDGISERVMILTEWDCRIPIFRGIRCPDVRCQDTIVRLSLFTSLRH
jgi:hypothetical protein